MPDRLTLFIDHHNTYKGARESFFDEGYRHFVDGQFDPIVLGKLICSRPPPGFERVLHEVRLYTGRPDATYEPKSYGPHMRQCQRWEAAGVRVFPHPLRYPWDFSKTGERPKEKGVDVHLAIDVVALAIEGEYDIGVVMSTDTDLRPALEYVTNKFNPIPRVEVAAWTSSTSNRRIPTQATRPTWCHYLTREDYESVHDPTDYSIA